ncbi:MAG: hypothetical protein ACLFVJ_20285 [Persicimonas sp.]
MANIQEQISQVRTHLDDFADDLQRHRRVVEGIGENPDGYDEEAVENYLSTLENTLADADFFAPAEESLAPLEQATDAAEQAVLDDARVFIDDHEIDGVELIEFDDSKDAMKASLLVESPKVNQLRGGRPRLELPDGREFYFTIRQTLIAEVRDDKTGYLELELGLEEV